MLEATTMPTMNSFVVKERLGTGMEFHGIGTNLSLDGLDLDTPSDVLSNSRFVWLEFAPEAEQDRIKALGEIMERTPLGVRVRFKHLFPDQRRKLAIMLDEDA